MEVNGAQRAGPGYFGTEPELQVTVTFIAIPTPLGSGTGLEAQIIANPLGIHLTPANSASN